MRDLRDTLTRRIKKNVDETVNVVERYNLEPTVRNFDSFGFYLKDLKNRIIRVTTGSYNDDVVHIAPFTGDIAIIFVDGMCLGWADKDDFMDAEDIYILKTKAIQPMPDQFDFYKTCPHLEEYGGFLQDNYWECAGCGTLIRASNGT